MTVKQNLLAVFLIIPLLVFSQTNNFPTNGNVTINDGHLIQTGSSNYISTQGPIKLKNYLLFDSDGDFTGSNYYTIQDDPSGNFLRMGYGFNNHLTIGSTGNVGIGAPSPQERLHIEGAGETKLRIHTESTTLNSGISFTGKRDSGINSNHYIGTSGTNNYNLSIDVDEHLFFKTNGSTRMFVHGNGNVGIGTTSPYDKLEVRDGSIRVSEGTDRMYFKVEETNTRSLIAFGDDSNDRLSFYYDHWNGTSSDVEVMSIMASGKVGIGTTSPDSKLTVKGNIHAEEVKVDLSVPGPDYVFKEDYDLKSLEEVQNYIKENGHLPNIPSAKEMEANGIDLGEMNMKLLEKIEELTLYTLEQEEKLKRMAVLEKKIIQMEKLMKELQKDKL
ncbi:hypothetical protein [Flagellimonas sp. 2504JD1-5]